MLTPFAPSLAPTMETPTRHSTALPEEFDEFDTYGNDAVTTSDERTMGLLAHLAAFAGFVVPLGNLLGPLVMYLVKKDESDFIADQAKEALNFNITVTIAAFVSAILIFVLIGLALLPLLGIAWLVLTIIGALKANEGVRYRYPLTLRLVK